MKIAISVPDEVFDSADELARELGISRSELYSTAVAEYLASSHPEMAYMGLGTRGSEVGQAR